MNKNKILLFIIIPVLFNSLLIGFYFSQIESLRQIIVPTISWINPDYYREFGLVESIQHLCLLATIIILAYAGLAKTTGLEQLFFLTGSFIFIFVYLEEIDYGLIFYDLFIDNPTTLTEGRNWHNQQIYKDQNVGYLKRVVDLSMVIWFIIIPFVAKKINFSLLKSIIPSFWFAFGLIIGLLFSRLAHLLDHMTLTQGLNGNVSEFRETSTYYFCLLYALQLLHTPIGWINSHSIK